MTCPGTGPKHLARLVSAAARTAALVLTCSLALSRAEAQVAGQNVNMVSGTSFPGGDPFLQRQNEPSLAVSSRNPLHLVAGANDYRTVDLPTEPGSVPGTLSGDAWLGVFKSFDGGQSWQSTLLPGYPQDQSSLGKASPLKVYGAAADPTVRAGANGLVYYSGIGFNRGTNIGGVFLARFLDLNQKENGSTAQGSDAIPYVDTKIIDTGTSGQFLDKPWLAVDIPRTGSGAVACSVTPPGGTSVSFVGGNVYMTWSRFTGSQSTKIMFARSLDCGKSWSAPIKISESNSINQGTNIAVDPVNGNVYVAWRRFAASNQPDAILVAKSTDFGQTFASKNTATVATIRGLDQGSTGTRFRTNALPSIAVSVDPSNVSRVHIAWAQRNATNQDAQVVVASSADGLTWGLPAGVDTAPLTDDGGASLGRGHQFMPQLTFSQGRLMVLYYDQRLDHTLGLFTPNNPFAADAGGKFYRSYRDARPEPAGAAPVFGLTIDDLGLQARRHTVDLRVAEAPAGAAPAFRSSSVSEYRIGLRSDMMDETGKIRIPNPSSLNQLQVNAPNLPLFAQGTIPFLGDYIDIAGQAIVPNGSGSWKFNNAYTPAPVFYATWTDNRDVVPPRDGNWANYTPVGGGGPSVLDPTKTTPACTTGQEGLRNQNVYSSRITEGLLVGSPQNVKPLFTNGKARAFTLTLQNLTLQDRTFTLSLSPGTGVAGASFEQDRATPSLVVTIAARSGAARSVFVVGSTVSGSVTVNVNESGANAAGLSGFLVLNPGGSVSPLAQPDGTTVDIGTVEIYTPTISLWNTANSNPFLNISNPNEALNISNLNISNLNISNPDPAILNISNLNISNLNISNLNISNPDPAVLNISNLNISNSTAANLNISNLNISNLNISNTTVSDTTYAVTNSGNTTHSYRVALYGSNPTRAPLQLIVTKNYSTPTSVGCSLQNQPQGTVLANVANAAIAPSLGAATDPNIPDGTTTNATMALAPGETAFVTLRGALTPAQMADLTRGLTPVITAHGANTNGSGRDFAALLFIQTTSGSLPVAVVGVPYNGGAGYQFSSVGGSGAITWSATGTLPTGLTLSPAGLLAGTPTGSGSFTFNVTATDGQSTPQTSTQAITLTVAARQTSTTLALGKNPAPVFEAVPATVAVQDSQADGTTSFPEGTVTVGPAPVTGSCVLSHTATAGVSSCALSLATSAVGTYPLTAAFAATPTHAASTSSDLAFVVVRAASAVALSALPNPSKFGQAVAFAARVTGSGATPSGAVTFLDGQTLLGTAPVDATGAATLVTSSLAVGSHAVTASYGGDASFDAGVSAPYAQVVNRGPVTVQVASTPNPSGLGQAVLFTVTVTATAPGTPTGTITLSDGSTAFGSAPLVNGKAAFSVSSLPAGSRSIVAGYSGDAVFDLGVSTPFLQVVNPGATVTVVASGPNPSDFGGAVTLAATVTPAVVPAGLPGPSGSVTFLDGGAAIGTAPLVGGSASLSTAALAIGTHPITAVYGGDSNYAGSGSGAVSQVVNMPPYTFVGFGSPLSTAGSLSSPTSSGVQNLGSATPIKYALFDTTGAMVTDLASTRKIEAIGNSTCSGAPDGASILLYAPTVGATGGSTFRVTTSGFVFNWDTTVVVPNGPGCYTVVVQTNDRGPARATTIRLQ